jgi:PAS domain S-box-containing protein
MSNFEPPPRSPAARAPITSLLARQAAVTALVLALLVAAMLILGYEALEVQSAVRAYVAGEGLWSKGEKDAVYELARYTTTADESHYRAFERALAVPIADRVARLELEKPAFDARLAERAFLAGGNRRADVPRMIRLFRRFRRTSFMSQAISVWEQGDLGILRLEELGRRLHAHIRQGGPAAGGTLAMLAEIDRLNQRLTYLESTFSSTLTDGSLQLLSLLNLLLVANGLILLIGGLWVVRRQHVRLRVAEENVERYADIVRNMQIGIHVWHLESPQNPASLRLVASNQAARALTGMPATEEAGGTILEVLPGLQSTDLPSLISEVVREGGTRDLGAFRYGDPQRRDAIFAVKAFALPGNSVGVTFEDITERHRAERELRESRAFLERSQEVGHIGSWTSGVGDDSSLAWSKEVFRIFGVRAEDFDGTLASFLDRVHPDDLQEVQEARRTAVAEGKVHSIEHRIVRPDGTVRWVLELADVERDDEGTPLRLIGVVQDITARRALEEQLQQAHRMESIGRLAGGVAHDFNNLLTAILGYAELLLAEMPAGARQRSAVDEILAAGHRAAALTRQLLAFSRRQVLSPQVIDLTSLVNEMRGLLQRLIGEDVTLETGFQPVGRVRADTSQLEQVIMNLAVNARDAMPRGGTLTIATEERTIDELFASRYERLPGRYARLSVQDTGIGMEAAVRAHIFEPFYTTKERAKGTGLGLATVYGIVQQSGGIIEVDSAPGFGSRFDIYLPCVEGAAEVGPPPAAEARPTTSSETVLLVEDEKLVRDLVHEILASAGYRVLVADGPEAALQLSGQRREPIHIIVTDVIMPGMSGPDLVKKVVVEHPEAAILFLSGYTDDALARHGMLETRNFLQKPFSPTDLLDKVRAILTATS